MREDQSFVSDGRRVGCPSAGRQASGRAPHEGAPTSWMGTGLRPNIAKVDRDGGQEDSPGLKQAANDGGEDQGAEDVDMVQLFLGV